MNLLEINNRLMRIELLLQRLVVPIQNEEGRQLALATTEQVKVHNKDVISRAKARRTA